MKNATAANASEQGSVLQFGEAEKEKSEEVSSVSGGTTTFSGPVKNASLRICLEVGRGPGGRGQSGRGPGR